MKKSTTITITGAAGQIGYSLLPRIANGELFGPDQPIHLKLLEVPSAMKSLEGIAMELEDCAFPMLAQVDVTDDPNIAFEQTDWALLVGARPRGPGMERKDLLLQNAQIFQKQGKSINDHASKDIRVLVVGNPANTNTLITMKNAPDIPQERFTAMTRLDHNRAVALLAKTLHTTPDRIKKMTIWGNHSSTMVVDTSCIETHPPAQAEHSTPLHPEFVKEIQQRGASVIEKRGMSSALSAAQATLDHLQCWDQGTPKDDWTSMAVISNGEYGSPKGLISSFPCICEKKEWRIVPDIKIYQETKDAMKKTYDELMEEAQMVASYL